MRPRGGRQGRTLAPGAGAEYWAAMSRDADHVALTRRGYEAFNDGDYEGVLAGLDPEIVWDASGGFPDGVVYHGHDGFRQFVRDAFKIWEAFALEPSEFHVSGDYVLVLGWVRLRARSSGVEVRPRWGWVWHFRDGKAISLLNYSRWDEATARFEAAVRRAGPAPESPSGDRRR